MMIKILIIMINKFNPAERQSPKAILSAALNFRKHRFGAYFQFMLHAQLK